MFSHTALKCHFSPCSSFLSPFVCPLISLSSPCFLISHCLPVHSVSFQPTASGFTWLSLAGLFYCSRGWLLTGIYTLLGPWMVNVDAQTVCTLLVAFCRSFGSLNLCLPQRQRLCLLSDTELSA